MRLDYQARAASQLASYIRGVWRKGAQGVQCFKMASSAVALLGFLSIALAGMVTRLEVRPGLRWTVYLLAALGVLGHCVILLVFTFTAPYVLAELAICFASGRIAGGLRSVPARAVVVLGGIAAATAFHWLLVRDIPRRYSSGQFTACKSNLKNIGTAMEMYSTDWSGKYPATLELLTPNYLKTIPECPAAGVVSYKLSIGSSVSTNDRGYEDFYLIECEGRNHPDAEADYPRYDGATGLQEGRDQRFVWYKS